MDGKMLKADERMKNEIAIDLSVANFKRLTTQDNM